MPTMYLVDFENVRSDGLKGIDKLLPDDKVIVFYSINADTITFEAHSAISNSISEKQFFRIAKGGKNALDFQLSSYMGYLIALYRDYDFCIISNDNGFNFVIDFWNSNLKDDNIKISKSLSIEESKNVRKKAITVEMNIKKEQISDITVNTASSKKSAVENKICELSSSICSSEESNKLCSYFYKSQNKNEFYRSIVKLLGQKRGLELYNVIKSEYDSIKSVMTSA